MLDLNLLERWLTGWSLARGLPLPLHASGGLVVEVGWPEQLRRHVFLDAGRELQECAARISDPFVYLKAAVDPGRMRQALPDRWQIEPPRYLMCRTAALDVPVELPAGYVSEVRLEHAAHVIRFIDAAGETAAKGGVVLHRGTAVFDRIETHEHHRGKGLATAVMLALDEIAEAAGVSERLLVATEPGRGLYAKLGWQVLAPYSTAVLPALAA